MVQPKGWRGESHRHRMAGMGISTNNLKASGGFKVTVGYLEDLIRENNEKYGTQFHLGGAYGNYELWAVDNKGDNHRLEAGSKKDVYEAFIKYRFVEKYRKDEMPANGSNSEKSIFEILKERGIPTDHHESDLYVKATPEAIELTKDFESREFFTSNIDGERWIDLPFRYDPFWDEKQKIIDKVDRGKY